MAIPVIGSNELNEKMLSADKTISEIKGQMNLIHSDLISKMVVIRNEQQYMEQLSNEIQDMIKSSEYDKERSKFVFSESRNTYGKFEKYGTCVHPEFLRVPRNVFNIITTNGPLFRGNVTVNINQEISIEARQALMHDSTEGKGIYFEEFDTDTVELLIEVQRDNLLGDTHFNVIELDPYLAGSFDVKAIQVKEMYSDEYVSIDIPVIKRVGRNRIILDRKYELQSINITFVLQFKNNLDKYPFGIQSLQFLNADFKTDSYIIIPIIKNEYIEFVGKGIVYSTIGGKESTTIHDKKIGMYFDFDGKDLGSEIAISEDDILYPFSRNTKGIYARIPLSSSLYSIDFLQIKTRV